MSSFELRPFYSLDIPKVANIDSRCRNFPWSENQFQESLDNGHKCWLLEIAVAGKKEITGFAVVSSVLDEWHLLNIGVLPGHQGKGYGAGLLDNIIAMAKNNDVREILLEVAASNKPAKRLYEKSGFKQIGLRKNYYPGTGGKEDALVYSLSVGSGFGSISSL